MVDWERVEQLRSKGATWSEIATDPRVGFHPDASAGEPGRALRAMYHRRGGRGPPSSAPARSPGQGPKRPGEQGWGLARVGYLLVPALGLWLALAYLAPSPIGLLVPAFPYLALGLAGAALVLIYALWRYTGQPRWSPVYRNTVIGGVVLGLAVAGTIGLAGTLVFGCPYLPPASAEVPVPDSPGWVHVPAAAWEESGRPVVYFFGAVWCPYCSASSWAVWKMLTEFGGVSGNYTGYSYGSPEPYPHTPEMVLAAVQEGSRGHVGPAVDFQVSEYTGSQDSVFPGPSTCYQSAYFSAYSGGSIPFVVVNGQYVHAMNTLVNPANLTVYEGGANGGAAAVENSVYSESGPPWTDSGPTTIQNQCCWMMALVVKSSGESVGQLSSEYGWSSAVTTEVGADLSDIG